MWRNRAREWSDFPGKSCRGNARMLAVFLLLLFSGRDEYRDGFATIEPAGRKRSAHTRRCG
jgi:hypothetical protein